MSPTDENHGSKVLATSASGTTLLIIVQLASKLFTFTANQSVLRNLSPAILGIATQLELYMVTVLYFSRESIRTAIQRQPLDTTSSTLIAGGGEEKCEDSNIPTKEIAAHSTTTQSVVNVSYLSLGMGVLFTVTFAIFCTHFASVEILQTPFYLASVAITGIASLLELGTEPFFAVVLQHMLYKKRAAVEMSAAFVKSVIVCGTFLWAAWTNNNVGVLPFALGYLGSSFTLFSGYSIALLRMAGEKRFSFLPKRIITSDEDGFLANRFSYKIVSLSANVFFQSVVKHLLTQGDSMMLATMASLQDQGIYSLASNYGGLAARILFQPIEESSRALFSSLLNSNESEKQALENTGFAKAHLVDIMQVYGIFSVVVFPLGPILVPHILHIVGGHRWASPEVVGLISLYCYYIPFLAYNGITEAFVSAAASPSELRKQAGFMGMFSACFAFAAYVFLAVGNLGAHGLVWANIVNMTIRTTWSYRFIQSYLRSYKGGLSLADVSLRTPTYIAGVTATAIIIANPEYFTTSFEGLLRALAFSAVYALLVLLLEQEYFMRQYRKIRQTLNSKTAREKEE